MNSLNLRLPSRKTGYIATALIMALTLVTTALASAAQITTRSIALSSSSVSATGVSYEVTFTPVANAEAFYIDFCSNTPLVGETCNTPTGFTLASAGTSTGSWTETGLDANTTLMTGTMVAGVPETVTITNVTNPSSAGTMYARIYTYDTAAHAVEADGGDDGYASATNYGADAYVVDTGGVAMSITPTIAVSGDVLESMTFCVADQVISAACGDAASNPPVLALGQDVGNGVIALTNSISTGDIHTQISTNATGGAVVSMKNNTTSCGGLSRAGAASFAAGCGILPALTGATIAAGDSEFGVKVAANSAQDTALTATGTLAASGTYNGSTYEMNYVAGNATGVTSTYGDPILNTGGAPVFQRNMVLTFGAQANNSTPAGRYSADISLIATGTF